MDATIIKDLGFPVAAFCMVGLFVWKVLIPIINRQFESHREMIKAMTVERRELLEPIKLSLENNVEALRQIAGEMRDMRRPTKPAVKRRAK